MVIRLFSFMAIMLLGSCEKELQELSMAKTPYLGNELRINGYYYSNNTTANDINIAVFYRDGVCIHTFTRVEGQDTSDFIENDILLNESLMSRLKSTPTDIGVFKVHLNSIELETWIAGRDITTFNFFGEILNDTTFLITKWTNNDSGKSYSENLTYRFKKFIQKPDSTNIFIK